MCIFIQYNHTIITLFSDIKNKLCIVKSKSKSAHTFFFTVFKKQDKIGCGFCKSKVGFDLMQEIIAGFWVQCLTNWAKLACAI